ncbi:MAG: phospholipid carrier-dependent glycosyltransferase [Nitrosomonadales bacterium]|nr:phospholipid carrier-dependent glycosyltransferase [Nitrosomonadales bacterium]
MQPGNSRLRLVWYVLAVLLAVLTYFYGLDSQQIPKNGDEYPYEHITRLTADSGHWLPLQSQLDNMRNTKPPLLFWQGIASTHWGQDWSLWSLRYPSVIYTLLTAALTFLLAWKLSRQLETGFIALLCYLAFFSTYRYGRPFLVNPAEVFWFFLPFFTLLYWRYIAFESRWLVPLLLGVEVGIGLLYKSFALIAPVGLCLTWWYLHHREYRWFYCLRKDALKVAITSLLALALFGLWFVLDPDPQSVWREFVVGENAGKFDPHGNYLLKFLWGGSSVWALVIGYPMNAGLLAIPVATVFFIAFRRRVLLIDAEKMLWIWMAALFIVFSLPSQRSARYLLEAMPGLAVLCALNWHRISRKAFIVSLLMAAGALAFIAFMSVHLQQEMPGGELYSMVYWLLLAFVAALILVALFVPKSTSAIVNVVALLVLLCFAAFLRPFDGAPGNYSAAVQRYAQGRDVWAPCDFRAKDEGYRFILPGAKVHGYREGAYPDAAALATHYRMFAVQLPLQGNACAECKILGQRLEIRGRQSDEEIKQMLKGDVFQHLFAKELLIEVPNMSVNMTPGSVEEGCRS